MGRPKGSKNIVKKPFDAERTVEEGIDGRAIKEMKREAAFDVLESKYQTIDNLRDLTKSGISVKNYPVQQFRDLSPEASDWGVSYFFPVAEDENGKRIPTYIDVPVNQRQLKLCEKKAAVMRKLGLRYFVHLQEIRLANMRLNRGDATAMQDDSMMNDMHIETI